MEMYYPPDTIEIDCDLTIPRSLCKREMRTLFPLGAGICDDLATFLAYETLEISLLFLVT